MGQFTLIMESPVTEALMDKWRLYLKDVESPELFIEFGFYYLIAAALQRRVWIPFGNVSLYPNLYVILTGPPGIGKGRVITQVKFFLEYHKVIKTTVEDVVSAPNAEAMVDMTVQYADGTEKKPQFGATKSSDIFPILPDSTSLRNLTAFVANNGRATRYMHEGRYKAYSHQSCAFILEELFNLFHEQKETKDISRFLTCAWDCGDYRHETHTSGKDAIKKMCVSLLAGTTPEFMKNVFGNDLMNEGFAARTLFIWGDKNRHHRFDYGEMTAEQVEAREDILRRVKDLANLCGPIEFTPEAYEFTKFWYEEILPQVKLKSNHNYKLDHYYSRKKMHLLKIAMVIHFSRSTSMTLEKQDVADAMAALERAEGSMHMALGSKGRNQLAPVGSLILMHLKKYGSQTSSNLLFEFAEEVNKAELSEILEFLTTTRQVKAEASGTNMIYTAIKQ